MWLQRPAKHPAGAAPHVIVQAENLHPLTEPRGLPAEWDPPGVTVRGTLGEVDVGEAADGTTHAAAVLVDAIPPWPQEGGPKPVRLIASGALAVLLSLHRAGDSASAMGRLVVRAAPGRTGKGFAILLDHLQSARTAAPGGPPAPSDGERAPLPEGAEPATRDVATIGTRVNRFELIDLTTGSQRRHEATPRPLHRLRWPAGR